MTDFTAVGGFSKEELALITKKAKEWLDTNTYTIETEMEKSPYSIYSCIATADIIRMGLDYPIDEIDVGFMKDITNLLIYQLIVLQEAVNKRNDQKRMEA